MELIKEDIAQRLKEFGDKRFPKIKDFAEAMEMKASTLMGNYLNGRSLPGMNLLANLEKYGCDIHWLFTGEYTYEKLSDIKMERDIYKERYEQLFDEVARAKDMVDNAATILDNALKKQKKYGLVAELKIKYGKEK